jgi:site-specific DNA recombinase
LLAALFEEAPNLLQPLPRRKNRILSLTGDFWALRRGREIRVIAPANGTSPEAEPVPSVVKAIARARDWYDQIVTGEIKTMGQLAHESGLRRRYIRQILHCATLSPQMTEALLLGTHRPNITLKEILQGVPLDWREQETAILRPH